MSLGRYSVAPKKMGLSFRLAFFSTILLSSTSSFAQTNPYAPGPAPSANNSIDKNGVDLISGNLDVTTSTVAIGPSDGTGLNFTSSFDGSTLRDSIEGAIYTGNGTKYVVFAGDESIEFTATSPTTFLEVIGNGHSLTYDGSNYYILKKNDGSIYKFSHAFHTAPNGAGPDGNDIGALVEVISPTGESRRYTYRREIRPILNGREQTGTAAFRRVQSVISNTGWMIKPEYFVDTIDTNLANWQQWESGYIYVFDNNDVGCDPAADHCTIPAGQQWPQLTPLAYATPGPNGVTAYRRPTTPFGTHNFVASYNGTKISSVTNNGVSTTYTYIDSGNLRTTTRTDSAGSEEYKFEIATGLLKQFKNALGAITLYEYNTARRATKVIYPQGNYQEYTYDNRGNVTQLRSVAKAASSDLPIVVTASYPTSCVGNVACNKPVWTRDAKGNQTDYTYDPTHGSILTVTAPAGANGIRPQTRYGYTALPANSGTIVKLTSVSTCQTLANCIGTADEVRTTISYGTVAANNLQPQSITVGAGNGTLTTSTTMTYTAAGDVATIDGPLPGAADTARRIYDIAARRMIGEIGPDPDAAGVRKNRATRITYNADGQVTLSEIGVTNGQSDAAWSALTPLQTSSTVYDINGRPVRASVAAGGVTYGVAQYSYDALGRSDCVVQRMDPAQWAAQSNACLPQINGPNGPDRVSKISYDAAGQVLKTQIAVGTAEVTDDVSIGYTTNGQQASVIDAEGNRTTYEYDGHDRLTKTRYPSPTTDGISSATDYEQPTYDANGNVTAIRLRDGQSIALTYDNLSRLTLKNLPGSETDVGYSYDLLGRMTGATAASHVLGFTYDALGRNLTQSGPRGTVSYQYDLAGRRTRMTWPDAFYITYDWNPANQLIAIRENGAASGVGVLASYAYDDLGRRTGITRGNGTTMTYGFDAISRLASLTQNLSGTANDLTLGFTYNPASQIATSTRSNDVYAWTGHINVNRPYITNGLNQYTASGAVSLGYDARGNLTSSGSDSYAYTSENLLKSGPGGTVLTYDPLLRLYQAGSVPRRFQYDGNALIAEYDTSDVMVRRYVHGPGVDQPVVWYEGSGTTDRRWLHADERGSVIAVTNTNGAVLAGGINSYDEYGIPAAGNLGRFQYTGQTWLPELGMYYYKARMYSPSLGRFMQTDPIGYGDGMNMYNYVGSDPVNFTDPSGTCLHAGGSSSYGADGWTVSCPGSKDYSTSFSNPYAGGGLASYWIGQIFRMGGPGPQTIDPKLPKPGQRTKKPQNNPCGSASMGQIRRELPSKGAVDQIVDGVSSYIDGVAWGATALAARTGLLGSNAQQQAISTNARLGTVLNQIASHPGQTASAVGAVASKYPLQMISRLGSGVAVSAGFTPYVGVPVSGLAVYGSAFKAAYQHPDAVAAAAVVGEMCP